MKLPVLQGVVERRLLVNYRVDPTAAAALVPAPFRPQLVDGWAVAGICLIRLGGLRPKGVPGSLGLRSENAAHRFAVEWDTPSGTAKGVFIPRRDSSSWLNTAVGGRLFPGEHHRARFKVEEDDERIRVALHSVDGSTSVDVTVEITATLESAVFPDVEAASRFFEAGAVGYSTTGGGHRFDGLELRTHAWQVTPARVIAVTSSLFEDPSRFPARGALIDSALVMRQIPVTWHPLDPIEASPPTGAAALPAARNP